jgi:large subunit ribosomal protein L4
MKVIAYTASGEERSAPAQLPTDVFDGTVHEGALHQVVTAIQAHDRQGTASTKTRGFVRGGSSKPWRQKGTGRARAGTIRSPLWRGGGVTFGPRPRSYDARVPRKLRRLATQSALNVRALDGDLGVVEPLEMEEPKTRTIAGLVDGVGATGANVLLLTDGLKRTVYLSARNLPGVIVRPWGSASAYDILWADVVLVESSALEPAAATGEDGGEDE